MRNPFVAILAVMGFLCAAVLGFSPLTRAGIQCPTATVQTVVARDCCDRVVRRAPLPGDRAFVQCRCAEKKSATEKAMASAKVDLFLVAGEPLEPFPPGAASHLVPSFEASLVSADRSPAFRPPV